MSVHGSDIQCFVLRDEVDELDNRHSGFWRSLVWWLWTVKTPIKMLAMMRKNWNKLNLIRIFYDGWKFRRQCVNVIDITWGRIYFSMCKNFGLSVQWPLMTRQRDVVVVRTALTSSNGCPLHPMFKFIDPPLFGNSGIKIISEFPVIKYDLRGRSHQISD